MVVALPGLVAFGVEGLERPKANVGIIPNPLGVVRVGVGFHLLVSTGLESVRETQANRVCVAIDFEFIIHEHKADEGHHRDTATGIIGGEAIGGASADFSEGGSEGVHIHLFVLFGICWNEDECAYSFHLFKDYFQEK
jgi:hypothetical protein